MGHSRKQSPMFTATPFLLPVVAFPYAAYASIKALKTRQGDDDKMWLTYWIIVSLFGFIETFTGGLIGWLPFYDEIKFVFLIALQIPQYQLASKIYSQYLNPFSTSMKLRSIILLPVSRKINLHFSPNSFKMASNLPQTSLPLLLHLPNLEKAILPSLI